MSYPQEAGWRGLETSREAALIITPHLKPLHEKVLGAFRRHADLTPEEATDSIGDMTLHSVRSRCSELKKLGLLEPTGETRRGSSGLKAAVLRVVK